MLPGQLVRDDPPGGTTASAGLTPQGGAGEALAVHWVCPGAGRRGGWHCCALLRHEVAGSLGFRICPKTSSHESRCIPRMSPLSSGLPRRCPPPPRPASATTSGASPACKPPWHCRRRRAPPPARCTPAHLPARPPLLVARQQRGGLGRAQARQSVT